MKGHIPFFLSLKELEEERKYCPHEHITSMATVLFFLFWSPSPSWPLKKIYSEVTKGLIGEKGEIYTATSERPSTWTFFSCFVVGHLKVYLILSGRAQPLGSAIIISNNPFFPLPHPPQFLMQKSKEKTLPVTRWILFQVSPQSISSRHLALAPRRILLSTAKWLTVFQHHYNFHCK